MPSARKRSARSAGWAEVPSWTAAGTAGGLAFVRKSALSPGARLCLTLHFLPP